jgi:predicted metal-binding protein
MLETIRKTLDQIGVFQHGVVDTADVEFSQEVRSYCEVNTCRQYGKTWCCPPAVGTVAECQERVQRYEKIMLFSKKYDLEDSWDFSGMQTALKDFKRVSRNLEAAVKPHLEDYLVLSNEGCGICKQCTYPDKPCIFPDKAQDAIEGYGIFVNKIAQQAGINYINGPNTVTFFGALLFRA